MKNLCLTPVYLKDRNIWVDCGHCRACRLKQRLTWVQRIIQESSYYDGKILRVDLTYDNDHLPLCRGVCPRHLQLFFKRLRKRIHTPFKYFVGAEYGPKTFRPHYHVVFLGLTLVHVDAIFRSWGRCTTFGFRFKQIIDQNLSKAIGYVVGYCSKKLGVYYGKHFTEQYGRRPPFQLQSVGIGKRFALSNQYLRSTGYLRVHGRDVVPPRYYRKVLNIPGDIYASKINRMQSETIAYVARINERRLSDYIVSRETIYPVPSRYFYGGFIVNQLFYRELGECRAQCDLILKNRESDWRNKI